MTSNRMALIGALLFLAACSPHVDMDPQWHRAGERDQEFGKCMKSIPPHTQEPMESIVEACDKFAERKGQEAFEQQQKLIADNVSKGLCTVKPSGACTDE